MVLTTRTVPLAAQRLYHAVTKFAISYQYEEWDMYTYLDAVVGLGNAFVQGLAIGVQQLALAESLPQLLLSQAKLMVQLGIRLLQHAKRPVKVIRDDSFSSYSRQAAMDKQDLPCS